MNNLAPSDTTIHRRNLIALGIIGLSALAFSIAFSPAMENFGHPAPQKQIAVSGGR